MKSLGRPWFGTRSGRPFLPYNATQCFQKPWGRVCLLPFLRPSFPSLQSQSKLWEASKRVCPSPPAGRMPGLSRKPARFRGLGFRVEGLGLRMCNCKLNYKKKKSVFSFCWFKGPDVLFKGPCFVCSSESQGLGCRVLYVF